MALADREYYGEVERRRSNSRLTPVVKALLMANFVVHILDLLLGHPLRYYGYFSIDTTLYGWQLWRFLTFQFLHADFIHLFLNSIGLYFFGPLIERHLGSRPFLLYYLLCGMAGAAFYTLISYIGIIQFMPIQPLIGASAGVYGIFVGVAVIAPNLRVQLILPPIELSMRTLAIVLMAIATVVILFNLNNAGGEAGHLGGAILGFVLMKYGFSLKRGPKVGIRRPKFRQRYESKLSPRSKVNTSEDSEVDAILDKISNEGFQSLTDAEKATLKRAAEKDQL